MKAPKVTSLGVSKLSANHIQINWDTVGSNFYYFVELAETKVGGAVIPPSQRQWRDLGYTYEPNMFIDLGILPNTQYVMRVSTVAKGFEQSDWVYTEEVLTFEKNAYTFEHMRELTLSEKFINEKFINNNMDYINFSKDQLLASLMTEDFQFTSKYDDISQVSDKIVKDPQFHEIQGYDKTITKICADPKRVMLAEMDGVLYIFERFQNLVKVSNDKGQTWKIYKALDDRVGNPVSNTCVYQSTSTTYVLGYDRIFYGRRSNDVRWSDDQYRFSDLSLTFAKVGDLLNLGFEVELFGTYAYLPGNIARYAEAMACSDDFLWVGAKNTVRYVDLHEAEVDQDPTSPSYGKKIFDEKNIKITDNDKIVIKKMDVINDKLLVLVTGEVKELHQDPTKTENVIDSKYKGIYLLEGDKFVRVYGNTEEELRTIEHEFTNMSTNGKEVFISYGNYKYTSIVPDNVENPHVLSSVKFEFDKSSVHDKHYHMGSIRAKAEDLYKWAPDRMEYYAEPWFTWLKRTGSRCWLTNDYRPAVIYPAKTYTKVIDLIGPTGEDRVNHEDWDKGVGTFYCKNIFFEGFKQYAGGVMIHKSSGEIVGFFQFHYRARDEAQVVWLPKLIMLKAELQNQEHTTNWKPEETNKERDPDLRPLLDKMIPDSYLLQDTNFEKFCEYYLQFLSDGKDTYYNKLLNLIRNKYPREENAYEYLWSEINKRNIYLDKAKRDAVVRLFESRKADFYSTKGTEASYKFLFKLLYNEDVEIDIESKAGLEYEITVTSDNIDQDIVGRRIYTPTGHCNVTYIEREYVKGKLQWKITIHNMIGRFLVGQNIMSENHRFKGLIISGIKGKDLLTNEDDFINRGRSYYVMKISSRLPTSRYASDVIRFVHPVGFGFIGITLLTMFINSGLSMKHTESIIEKLLAYKFDSGYPSVWIDRISVLNHNGEQTFDGTTGEAIYALHPRAGEDFEIPTDYDTLEGYVPPEDGDTSYTNMEEYLERVPPSERRRKWSPLFDQSSVKFSNFRKLTSLLIDKDLDYRLKDNIGNPRDPVNPTQVKV
ncbi:putative baseplate wedge subunit [Morganella phage vB_MmoM_Rgz1]|nr:putative baseplate wedge subunit [Morganella phage vB_MmoM_Rgz1]